MIHIKNYYDQQRELNTAKSRLKTLEEKRKIYFNATQPKAVVIKDTVVMSPPENDVLTKYMAKIEKIDKEKEILKQEIAVLEKDKESMEENLREMKGTLQKVFVARYIDGLTVSQIAKRVNYSEPHIYHLLTIIKNILKENDNKK